MEKQFVSYELSVKLKELGFDEKCLAVYTEGKLYTLHWVNHELITKAPLWQQAFDWFREYYGFTYTIDDFNINGDIGYNFQIRNLNDFEIGVRNKVIWNSFNHSTYHEARNACLEKLIELVKGA